MSQTSRSVKNRPTSILSGVRAQFGLNSLSICFIAVQAVMLAVTAMSFRLHGLSIEWDTTGPIALFCIVLIVWLGCFMTPELGWGRVAEPLFVFALLLSLTKIVAPAQYPAAALSRPPIDWLLASADAMLGVHVPTIVEWTRDHPTVNAWLELAYESLALQLTLTVPVLGILLKDRSGLWEYAFHYHFCLIVTLICFAAFPALHAFTYYGFQSTFDNSRLILHLEGVRAGSLKIVRFTELEGLVSMPSFHMAGGMIVTWVFRRHPLFLVLLIPLNAALITATFMSGTHYVIDVIATVPLFVLSVVIYRRWAQRLLRHGDVGVACPPAERAAAPSLTVPGAPESAHE